MAYLKTNFWSSSRRVWFWSLHSSSWDISFLPAMSLSCINRWNKEILHLYRFPPSWWNIQIKYKVFPPSPGLHWSSLTSQWLLLLLPGVLHDILRRYADRDRVEEGRGNIWSSDRHPGKSTSGLSLLYYRQTALCYGHYGRRDRIILCLATRCRITSSAATSSSSPCAPPTAAPTLASPQTRQRPSTSPLSWLLEVRSSLSLFSAAFLYLLSPPSLDRFFPQFLAPELRSARGSKFRTNIYI